MSDCGICGKPDEEKIQIFKGEPFCCMNHQKMLEMTPEQQVEWLQNYIRQSKYTQSAIIMPIQPNSNGKGT